VGERERERERVGERGRERVREQNAHLLMEVAAASSSVGFG
jgi:hypothetical protein